MSQGMQVASKVEKAKTWILSLELPGETISIVKNKTPDPK